MTIPSPHEFFGFELGEDGKLARWSRIVEYFRLLERESPRVRVVDLGKTTEGRDFIMAIITSPNNMARLEEYKEISRRLAYPYDLSEDEARSLAEKGRAVVAMSGSIHATEVGGTQSLTQLAYELASRSDGEAKTILDNVILLLFPCFNPDGQEMVVEWYEKYRGTEYEGSPPPWLYHKYTGHDNNRDAFMLTQAESRHFARIVYREWIPQVYVDHHQMWMAAARFFISPEMDPIYPEIDPLVWREVEFLGTYAASRLARRGLKGVETYSPFTPDFASAFQTMADYMNIVGILTESASARIATPIYIHPHQLGGYRRGRRSEQPQMTYPDPWPGGWWRLKDIVTYQKEASYAILLAVARMKSEILYNMYVKAKRSIERGFSKPPRAFIIPVEQHDPLTALKLVGKLMELGIEVHVAEENIAADGRLYPEGSFVVLLAQPRRPLAMKLLERYLYPDNEFTRDREGKPLKPYDLATERLADFMGVRVEAVNEQPRGKLSRLEAPPRPSPSVAESRYGWIIDPRLNDAHRVAAKLLSKGVKVYRAPSTITVSERSIPPGAFYIPSSREALEILRKMAAETGVEPIPLDAQPSWHMLEARLPRIGIYQRYYGGNMDEGWTRWILDTYGFPYQIIRDEPIKTGKLRETVDVLILPSDSLAMMMGENIEEELSKRWKRPIKMPPWPPEYRSGFGKEGVENLRKFVEDGGVILALGDSYELATKGFKLPLKDLAEEISDPRKFFCPGSTIRTIVDPGHPIGWGMPQETPALFIDKPVLSLTPHHENDKYVEVARFADKDLLLSGWLIGEEYLARKPAVLEVRMKKGRLIIYAIRPQFRAQTHGTFKLLFNALYSYPTHTKQ